MSEGRKTIEIAGTPDVMGRLQGESTAEDWIGLMDSFGSARAPEVLEKNIAEYCPRQMERMRGIALGAGVSLDTVLIALSTEIMHTRVDHYIGACSAAAVRGRASVSASPIIAKNYDSTPQFENAQIARISRPADAFHSIDITLGFMAGSHEGVNEKGLAISYNNGHSLGNPPSKLVPISLLAQEALERCESTEQAVVYFENSPRAGSALLMIADANGDVAGLELSAGNSGIRRPDGDRIAHTNHYHLPHMVAIDIPHEACYSDKMPEQLRGLRVRESSELRYERLARLLSETTSFSEEALIRIMSDHGEKGDPNDNTICRHGPYYTTNCSVLIFPMQRLLKVAWGAPCETLYETLALEL